MTSQNKQTKKKSLNQWSLSKLIFGNKMPVPILQKYKDAVWEKSLIVKPIVKALSEQTQKPKQLILESPSSKKKPLLVKKKDS